MSSLRHTERGIAPPTRGFPVSTASHDGGLPGHGFALPSGQTVTLEEAFWDQDAPEQESWLRLRFLAPDIGREGKGLDYDAVADDFPALCENFGLPMLKEAPRSPVTIFVSLADRPVEFGQANPEATQFFEVFQVDDDGCIWGAF